MIFIEILLYIFNIFINDKNLIKNFILKYLINKIFQIIYTKHYYKITIRLNFL